MVLDDIDSEEEVDLMLEDDPGWFDVEDEDVDSLLGDVTDGELLQYFSLNLSNSSSSPSVARLLFILCWISGLAINYNLQSTSTNNTIDPI